MSDISHSILVRYDRRLNRQPPEQHAHILRRAAERASGKHPRPRDRALVHLGILRKLLD